MTDTPPPTAYIVTSGEYSDYRIDAVFLDRALAERHAAELGKGDEFHRARVEEHDILAEAGERVPVHCVKWTAGTGHQEWVTWQWREPALDRPQVYVTKAPDGGIWQVMSLCADLGLARRALHDRLARLKAEAEGIG